MSKETRVGVGVLGVLLVISLVVLVGRLTRDPGPGIDVNIDVSSPEFPGSEGNDVPRRPIIERQRPLYGPNRESPVPQPTRTQPKTAEPSFLPDPDGQPVAKAVREITLPEDATQPPRYLGPAESPFGQDARPRSPVSPERRGLRENSAENSAENRTPGTALPR